MRMTRYQLRVLVESFLLEGFKDDQRWLIEKYPEHARDLSTLQPKWIAWLSARFGERPKVEETHPFEDAVATVLNFSRKDAAIGEKYRSNEQFRTAIDARFPPDARSWSSLADPTTMTVDEMELILGLSERKKQRIDVESDDGTEGDRVGKVGPWNLWMPTTRERSCRIAGYDPVTRNPKTTWCTARMAGSNLFYNYIGRHDTDMTLFYIIRDDPMGDDDWLSLGFVNGKPDLKGQRGGVSVDRANKGLTSSRLRSILGPHHDEIMATLTTKNRSLGGQHPARQKIKDAALSTNALRYLVTGLSKDEATDLKKVILDEPAIDPSVLSALAADADEGVRRSVAGNPSTPPEVISALAADRRVRGSVARNPSAPPEVLSALAADADSGLGGSVAGNPSAPPEVLSALASDANRDVRGSVALNPSTPPKVLSALAADADRIVRGYASKNPSAPPEVLSALAADADQEIRWSVARNPSTPPKVLSALAADASRNIRGTVAGNPNAPPEVLSALAADADRDIRWSVTRNPSTPPEVLSALAADADEGIRRSVAGNPSTPPEVLSTLAADADRDIRGFVAGNPSTPPEVLQKLTKDRSGEVKDAARHALTRRQAELNESRLRRLIRQML